MHRHMEGSQLIGSGDLDYHNIQVLGRYILNNAISTVINCSGFTGRPNVDEGEIKKEECWRLNVVSPLRINELCNALGIKYIHISSGCIYSGYEKEFVEEDKPNFGLFDYSSFYSKSKHAFELMSAHLNNKILRIRMPISPDTSSRNFLIKIKNYDNLISEKNSKTYIPDLCKFIENLLEVKTASFWSGKQDVYNVVNPNPLTTKEMVARMVKKKYFNERWTFVDISKLNIVAPRSNCVLNGDKASKIYQLRNEIDILEESLNKIVCAV